MARSKKAEEKVIELISHMLELGWKVNHDWIAHAYRDVPGDVDFEKLILGKVGITEAHLITKDGKYTAKFDCGRLQVFQKDPKWRKLCNLPIGKVEKTEKGVMYKRKNLIAYETIEIVLDDIYLEDAE